MALMDPGTSKAVENAARVGFGLRELLRALEVSTAAFRADKVRSRALIVSVAIGTAVLITLTSLAERSKRQTVRSLERAGLSNVFLLHSPRTGAGDRALSTGEIERLGHLLSASSTASVRMVKGRLESASGTELPIYAISSRAASVFGLSTVRGRRLSDLDVRDHLPLCVVGSRAFRQTFGTHSAVGQILRFGPSAFEVVGELAPSPSETASVAGLPSLDWDGATVVPLGSEPGSSRAPLDRYPIDVAVLHFPDPVSAEEAAVLLRQMDPSRFGSGATVVVTSPVQTLRQYRQTRRSFDRMIVIIGFLTALSVFLGVYNAWNASVTSRSTEIGLRRAVGARALDILLQFEVEAAILGLVGGAVGLAAGAGIDLVALSRSGEGSGASLATLSLLALFCVGLGLVAGLRPAVLASRVEPVAALREE